MVVCGIDPGKTGAIALYDSQSNRLTIDPIPTRKLNKGKEEIDVRKLFALLPSPDEVDLVIIEKVGTRPSWGASSSFDFGQSVGIIRACVELKGLPVQFVRPQEWKKKILMGTDKSKEAAIAFIFQRFPQVNLIPPGKRTPSSDFAEAALLALYGLETKHA